MNRTRRRISHAGFSLLEVLVAFSIAAMAVGVLFQIYSKGSTALALGEEYAQAVLIAESRLGEWHAGLEERGVSSGTEGRYAWRMEIEESNDADLAGGGSSPVLNLVMVEVTWESRGQTRAVKLQTLKPSKPS